MVVGHATPVPFGTQWLTTDSNVGSMPTACNHKWVSDITEIRILDGKLNLCQVLNLYDGVIVGRFLDRRQTAQLVIQAAALAICTGVAPKEIILVDAVEPDPLIAPGVIS